MSINIFQLNTYLIPNIPFIKSKSEYQTRRGRLIADHLSQSISNYDILSLQEMWGDQLGIIDDVFDIFSSFFLNNNQSVSTFPLHKPKIKRNPIPEKQPCECLWGERVYIPSG
eukprot:TRINITY_DN2707_c0_g1_i1.p1 TRINITY_DN2707_c0_g1~~TRINITY_DN2707_c0_g1_i1.p1  ORF type:complete len:113 (-),score=14.03 TRINITY_DN2707_c0_g1_i1:43-381(-)